MKGFNWLVDHFSYWKGRKGTADGGATRAVVYIILKIIINNKQAVIITLNQPHIVRARL